MRWTWRLVSLCFLAIETLCSESPQGCHDAEDSGLALYGSTASCAQVAAACEDAELDPNLLSLLRERCKRTCGLCPSPSPSPPPPPPSPAPPFALTQASSSSSYAAIAAAVAAMANPPPPPPPMLLLSPPPPPPPPPSPSPPPPPPMPPPIPPTNPCPPTTPPPPPPVPPAVPQPPQTPPAPQTPPRQPETTRFVDLPLCHATCYLFALDDGQSDPIARAAHQTTTCGSFYAAGCGLDQQFLQEFETAHYGGPSAPPSPLPPLQTLQVLPAGGSQASGMQPLLAQSMNFGSASGYEPWYEAGSDGGDASGFDLGPMGVTSAADAVAACSDGSIEEPAGTLCQSRHVGQVYAAFRFEESSNVPTVYAVEIVSYREASPPSPPPSAPPPQMSPPKPPPPPPLPVFPPIAPCTPEGARTDCRGPGLIRLTNNGRCEDGGEGAVASLCALGCATFY